MSTQEPSGMASKGSMSLHGGFTRYSSVLGLQIAFLALMMTASGVNAQIPGTEDLCSCSPTVFNFTFSYGSTCPGNIKLSDGISDLSCLAVAVSETDPSDRVPVTIDTITILELNMNTVITKTTYQGPFEDGDTVEYASISSYRNLTDTYFPFGLQVISQGLNVAGETVINTWAIEYTGSCDFEPVFEEDAQIGWIEITGTEGPFPIYCPANDTPTIAPTIGAPTIAPTMRATTKPPADSPIIAPTVAPTEAPTVASTTAPVEDPTEAPTEAPVTEAPVTGAPVSDPTEDPTEAPTEAPVTGAPVSDPTEAPTEAPVSDPTEAPTEAPVTDPTEAPVADPTKVPVTEAPIANPTEAPVADPTEAPVTEAPVSDPSEAPVTEVPTTIPTKAPASTSPVATPPPATDPPTTPDTPPPVSPPTDMSLSYSDFLNTEFVLREYDWYQ